MIYDPARRALELRQRILESMTAEEIEEYAEHLERDGYADSDSRGVICGCIEPRDIT